MRSFIIFLKILLKVEVGALLNQYTAITTKIRGMRGKLLKKDDYINLSYLSSEGEIASYLKRHPGYQYILENVVENKITRVELEGLLNSSIYEDYNKLFRFANFKQRKFLQIHAITYEVVVLKKFLRRAFNVDEIYQEVGNEFLSFLSRRSRLDLKTLQNAKTLQQFREALVGSRYYRPLKFLERIENPTLFDYETALDTYAFTVIWQEKNKLIDNRERKTFEKIYGTQFDLLNIVFIFRYKMFYDLPAEQIASLLIPINFRMKPDKITQLLEARNEDEFWRIIETTVYARRLGDFRDEKNLDKLYENLMDEVIRGREKEEPYSAATMYAYLHDKEKEVSLITRIIEAIHYGRNKTRIQQVINQKFE